jgi:hypothetical protein
MILRTSPLLIAAAALALSVSLPACKSKSSPAGTKVDQPFSGNKYESNAAWFRVPDRA